MHGLSGSSVALLWLLGIVYALVFYGMCARVGQGLNNAQLDRRLRKQDKLRAKRKAHFDSLKTWKEKNDYINSL